MKKTINPFAAAVLGLAALTTSAGAEAPARPASAGAPVTIDVSGIRAGAGDLFVSLQTREQFMQPSGAYGTVITRPAAGARSVTLEGVAPGVYAASVWHDFNGNRRWDGNEVRAADPAATPDGWAMLDGDKLRATPKFDEVDFTHGAAPRTLKLDVRYGY